MKCIKCGIKIKDDSNMCIDCKREEESKKYKIIAIVLGILGLIGGIIIGNNSEEFNVYLMLIVWLSTFFICLPIFAIGSICERLDIIIRNAK